MAKVIQTQSKPVFGANHITYYKDGTTSIVPLVVGDTINDLNYNSDGVVMSVSGKITDIGIQFKRATNASNHNSGSFLDEDAEVVSVSIDHSTKNNSKVTVIPAKDILEFTVDGDVIAEVNKVEIAPTLSVYVKNSMSDGSFVDDTLTIGKRLCDLTLDVNGKDIVGNFVVTAFLYNVKFGTDDVEVTGAVFTTPKTFYGLPFSAMKSRGVEPQAVITDPTSLVDITSALEEEDEVYAQLDVDVTIPKREDGRITSTFINEGKTLNIDLNGHDIDCQAFAFYVNGGTLNISNGGSTGAIKCHIPNKAYPAVQVVSGGVCNMESGTIDTTDAETASATDVNWIYGVVCSGDGVFNMTGGSMKIGGAAGISITNGTASGEGAKFTIGGDAVITSTDCASVYLADNKSVVIKDNAVLNNGIVARMGDITIQDNAVVNSVADPSKVYNLGLQACLSGVETPAAAFLALTGVYRSDLGNDMNVVVKDNAVLNGSVDDAINIAFVNTKYDQVVNIDVESAKNLNAVRNPWKIYTHDELAALAAEGGKTLGAETNTTTLTVKVNNVVEYPVVDSEG